MNIALEQTEEVVNGQVKNNYGDAFIRGNNGMCMRALRGALHAAHPVVVGVDVGGGAGGGGGGGGLCAVLYISMRR